MYSFPSQLGISQEYQPYYVIYQQQGDLLAGPPLSDDRIVGICQTYGDSASTLRFSVQPSQAATQSPPLSTPSSFRGLPPSRIPSSSNHMQSPHQMIPQLSIDTTRLGNSNQPGIPPDRMLPPLPNITPPIPPIHTRPIPSTAQNQNQPNGYMMPPNSAYDDQSETGSGYSGGPEDTPHHPYDSSSHRATLARMKSRGRMNFPNLPNPPAGPPPPPPNIHSSPPPPPASTVATIGPSRISDKDRNELTREKELPLSLPTSSGPSSRSTGGNIPPPAPPPTHLPPPLPGLSSSTSSDSRRPPDTSRATRPSRNNDGTEERGRDPDKEWVWIDNRPGTSTGAYDPPQAAPYERPGTSTGMYHDPPSRVDRPPLSPMARSTSSDGRPRDPWTPAALMQYDRSGATRQNGTSHTGIGLRLGFSPKIPGHGTPVNVVNGQRSPQNNGTAGGYVAGPRGAGGNENYGMQNTNQGQMVYNTPSKRDGRRMASNGESTPIVRAPVVGKGLRSPNSGGMVNASTFYHASVSSAQLQGQGQSQEPTRAETTANNRAARIGAYGEPRGLTLSRSQDNLRNAYLFGNDLGTSSVASTPGIGAGGNGDLSRLSPVGRGANSRLPPPPMNAQLYINSDLPPTPSSFANHPYAPRSPTMPRQIQQVALNATVGNGSHRSPITQPSRQPNTRDYYPLGVGERVGQHPFARTSTASPQTNGPAGVVSPRQRSNRAHAASDAYNSPPSPPANGQGPIPGRLLPNPNSNVSASTSAPASTLNLSILPPGPPPPSGRPPPVPLHHRPSISEPKYKQNSDELPPGAMDPTRKKPQQQQLQSAPYDNMGGLPSPPSAASPTPPARMDSLAKSQAKLLSQTSGGSLSGHTSSPAASPASPRTPLLGESEFTAGLASPRKRRMMELVNGEEEGTLKVQDFVNNRQWREGFLAGNGEGTLMQHHFNSNPTLQRSGNDSSRRNGSQSPGTPVASRSPLQQPSNAPWNTHSEEEDEDDEDYENDPSASDGANNLWQKPLVKRISRIYKMGKSLRFSTHSSMSRRGGRSGDGLEELSVPALPTLDEPSSELMSGTSSRKNAGVPMDTIDLGGTVFSFRPAAEQVLEKMDNFFPDHDLDKPIMESSNNNAGTSGNNSGGSSPTMVDAPYNAHSAPGLGVPSGSGANAPTPTGSPLVGGATIMASPSPMGISRQNQRKTIRTLANQGKRRMDRLSKDGAASDTMLRRRSTKFWGNSIKELQPAEFDKLGTTMPESPGGGNKPEVMQWFKGKLLGKGTYGKVYLGFNATSKEVFAVKRVEMPESRSDHQDPRQKQVLDAIKSESDTLRDLDHPNIVAYLGYEQTEKYFSM